MLAPPILSQTLCTDDELHTWNSLKLLVYTGGGGNFITSHRSCYQPLIDVYCSLSYSNVQKLSCIIIANVHVWNHSPRKQHWIWWDPTSRGPVSCYSIQRGLVLSFLLRLLLSLSLLLFRRSTFFIEKVERYGQQITAVWVGSQILRQSFHTNKVFSLSLPVRTA